MASSSSNNNNNNGVPLTTQIDWYKIRDTFFGRNCASQNIPLALKLAASCDHPDARWLAAVCAGKEVETEKDARRVFSALGLDDARALCFAWLLGDQEDPHPLLRSVELGFGFAAAEAAFETEKEERFKLAQLAASLGERDGFFLLGVSLRDREARDQDLGKVKENLLRASRLGHVAATCQLGELFEESDPQRWRLWGRAAASGEHMDFLFGFRECVKFKYYGSPAVMFAIGHALRGHVDEEAKTVFGDNWNFVNLVNPAKQAIAFYEAQISSYRKAVDNWTLVGIRFGVVKDIRRVIAELIWSTRGEALCKVPK